MSSHVPKLLLKKADTGALSLKFRELDLMPINYENCKDIDVGKDKLVRYIKEAVAKQIPVSRLVSSSVS